MDLLAFERKLDATILRKRLDIQEALKHPMKQKRKLRIYISNTFSAAKQATETEESTIASWELRVEGGLLGDNNNTDILKVRVNKTLKFFSTQNQNHYIYILFRWKGNFHHFSKD